MSFWVGLKGRQKDVSVFVFVCVCVFFFWGGDVLFGLPTNPFFR